MLFMRRLWLIFSQAVTVALAVFFVVATLKPHWLANPMGAALRAPTQAQVPPALGGTPPVASSPVSAVGITSFSAAAKRASPAVVSIMASKAPPRHPQMDDPWFQFFFGDRLRSEQRPQVGLGSAVIVSAEGYLLTNNHVIDGADDIEVQLPDGRSAQAKVIGTDPETDLAVLKINLDRLPVIDFGNAEALQVGDAVLAIGNPFGVGQTVTSGIVSALGRTELGLNTFENFIQTDAAINPGNSGGALVDAAGQLVGINTAIYSRSGGSMGIGFAVPASTASHVMQGLIREGSVARGWIGVEPRDLTPEIAASLRLPIQQGSLVTGVLQNGPAAKGGMQPGDVVIKVADKAIANTPQLLNAIAAIKPQTSATVVVQRGDRTVDLQVTAGQRPKPSAAK